MIHYMSRSATRRFPRALIVGLAMLATGCAGGVDVTEESLKAARDRWNAAGIRDYELEWASTGLAPAHYVVTVHDGKVESIESIAPNGRRGLIKPAAPRFYSVDGLFTTISDELAQLETDRPFGQPRGTRAVFKFKPDPKYGFPRMYRRDVMGAPLPLAIDVLGFHVLGPTAASRSAP